MKTMNRIISILAVCLLLMQGAFAAAPIEDKSGKKVGLKSVAAGCTPAAGSRFLTINNTRAIIHTGGDKFWDLIGRPIYEIPKGDGVSAIFAGALWLGGTDVSGQLKVAAQRFRSNGNDFWPGPLSTVNSEIDAATCAQYDNFWETFRTQAVEFSAWFEAGLSDAENGTTTQRDNFPNYVIPRVFEEWPAHGRNFAPYDEDFYLAPFVDRNGDGFYNPNDGDYPAYDLSGATDCNQRIVDIYGDQNLWWLFNDKGNVHTESGAQAIGMEIRAQAFAFATNDEVNNMTFYNYELVNRSTFTLTDTYFGVWIDADIGFAFDDYVGCDVLRGLGFAYNGDNFDEAGGNSPGYGANPPAIGVDFFQGPFQDNDGVDNPLTSDCSQAKALGGITYSGMGIGYGDGIIDNERFGMRRFLYHDNNNGPRGDPATGIEYYNFLRGIWRDATDMIYGGTGYISDPTADPNTLAEYMFPGVSDTVGFGTNCVVQPEWTEITAGNQPFDRRFMQSAGPFTLAPGAVNNITYGIVWARASSGGNFASVEEVIRADDKTQALFDACFQLLGGPDAPDLVIRELDQELIIMLDNKSISNNRNNLYQERDPFIIPPDTFPTRHPRVGQTLSPEDKVEWQSYKFQGYLVYQLSGPNVSPSELENRDRARLIFQCDIKDGVSTIKNWVYNSDIDEVVPSLAVRGANEGISMSFSVTEDRFAQGNPTLINHKTYYFMAIAYAHNEFMPYSPGNPQGTQPVPFLPSRKSPTGGIQTFSGIPYKTEVMNGGMTLNSKYGDGVEITRIEGTGNGGNRLDMKKESREEALLAPNFRVENPVYNAGAGPINIKVVDPLNVIESDYVLTFRDTTTPGNLSDAYFELFGDSIVDADGNPDVITYPATIRVGSEFILVDYGISINIGQVVQPGTQSDLTNGFLSATMTFDSETNTWLGGVPDVDAFTFDNWILAGTVTTEDDPATPINEAIFDDWRGGVPSRALDSLQVYEGLLGGIVAPMRLTAPHQHGPKPALSFVNVYNSLITGNPNPPVQLNYLSSVDIVITPDKSKWTRVPVIEMHSDPANTLNGAVKGSLRQSKSIDKNGVSNPDSTVSEDIDNPNFISPVGMSWFPGYAVNIETGERLNMAFGEDSYLAKENGADMIWNPTSTIFEGPFNEVRFGGKHYLMVFRNNVLEDQRVSFPLDYNNLANRMPAYDYGKFIHDKLQLSTAASLAHVYRAGMWCMLPVINPGFSYKTMEEGLVPGEVEIKLRVTKSYELFAPGDFVNLNEGLNVGDVYYVDKGPITHDGATIQPRQTFTATSTTFDIADASEISNQLRVTEWGALPTYQFSTKGMAPLKNQNDVAQRALDLINVVPNPYYAYSQYESDRLDNRIKITNLPQACDIRIYSINGVLVRTFVKDDPTISSVDWDMKNMSNVTVASGIYYIHVDVPGVGEKVVKWMGVMRRPDLDAF